MSSGRDPVGAERRPPGAAVQAVRAAVRGIHRPIVLVDGPSGAGKSTFADLLVADWSGPTPDLVRLDDVYPGWHGLDPAVSALRRDLVAPWLRGAPGRRRGWDWAANSPGAVTSLRPGRALVIEGCGALGTVAGLAVETGARTPVRVWVDAPYSERRRRALARDAGAYDPYWDLWEAQWRRYLHRMAPTSAPVIRVRMR
ncbi:ATP-binding protein [Agromyces allii]|uniref:AAA family ATPase n=1 Tax=Agromyces allii TaxID=393607 RepID=A0ABN2QEZ6_9MICO|nr:ATP-binding protein [Agromyces allii]